MISHVRGHHLLQPRIENHLGASATGRCCRCSQGQGSGLFLKLQTPQNHSIEEISFGRQSDWRCPICKGRCSTLDCDIAINYMELSLDKASKASLGVGLTFGQAEVEIQ